MIVNFKKRFGFFFQTGILWLLGLLSGCSLNDRMSTFDAKGPIAQMQLDLFKVTLYVTGFLFITVGGALLYTLIRFRERQGDEKKPFPSQMHGNPLIEVSLIGFSTLCLVIIAIPTVRGIWIQEELPAHVAPEDVLEITVRGYQWWWVFEYPEQGIITANELAIPKGRVVKLNLRSADVIHSFWLPKIAGKTDLMPGRQNSMWIQADEEGHYYGQCAEFCGEAHAYMLFRTDVFSEERWEQWVAHQQKEAAPPAGTASWAEFFNTIDKKNTETFGQNPVLQGARLFMKEGGCIQCHSIDGAKDANGLARANGVLGPNLTHVAMRKSLAAGLLDNRHPDGTIDPEKQLNNFLHWTYASETIKPGNLMYETVQETIKSKNLTEEDFRHIAIYLQTLK